MNVIANLAGKALLPTALVLVAKKISGNTHEGALALSQASDAVQAAAAAARKATDAANSIAKNAPDTAGKGAHEAGNGAVKGVENGVLQVAAVVLMAPVTIAGRVFAQAFPSETDRKHIEDMVNPTHWKIF
jgi:Tfp pilus assembly protein PilX